jgi:hypothetical protein
MSPMLLFSAYWMARWCKIFANSDGYLAGQETNCFYKLQKFIIMFTEACHGTVLWATLMELATLYTFSMTVPSITVAAQFKEWNVFARSNTGIVGSHPTQDMDVCLRLFYVYVVLCR